METSDEPPQLLQCGECRGSAIDTKDLAKDPQAVVMSTSILRLWEVDAVGQCFRADIIVHMWWFEQKFVDEPIKDDIADVDDTMTCIPKLFYENSLEIEEVDAPLIKTTRKKKGVVHWESRVRGRFHEAFELRSFPFDVQSLTIKLRINSKMDKELNRHILLSANRSMPDLKPDVALAEWIIYKPSVSAGFDARGKMVYCAYITIRRRHWWFLHSMTVSMGMISSLGFTSLSISSDSLGDRASIVLTLLLTMVAEKFNIEGLLPRVPYETTFDTYVNSCFGCLCILLVKDAVAAAAAGGAEGRRGGEGKGEGKGEGAGGHGAETDVGKFDIASHNVILFCWVFFQISFAAVCWFYLKRLQARLGDPVNVKASESRTIRAQEISIIPWRKFNGPTKLRKSALEATVGPKVTVFHDTAAPEALTALIRMEKLAEQSHDFSKWHAAAADADIKADPPDPTASISSLASTTRINKKVSKKSLEASSPSATEARKSWIEAESPDSSPKMRAAKSPAEEEEANPEPLSIDASTFEAQESVESPAPQDDGAAGELAPPDAGSKKKKPTKKSKAAASVPVAETEAEATAEPPSETAAADNDDRPDISSSSVPKGKRGARKKKPTQVSERIEDGGTEERSDPAVNVEEVTEEF